MYKLLLFIMLSLLVSCGPQYLYPMRGRLLNQPATMYVADEKTKFISAGLSATGTDGLDGTYPLFITPEIRLGMTQKNFTVEPYVKGYFGRVEMVYDSSEIQNTLTKSSYGFGAGIQGMVHIQLGNVFHLGIGGGGEFHIEGGEYEKYRDIYDTSRVQVPHVSSGSAAGGRLHLMIQQQFVMSPSFEFGIEEQFGVSFHGDRPFYSPFEADSSRLGDTRNAPIRQIAVSPFITINSRHRIYGNFGTSIYSDENDFEIVWGGGYSFRFLKRE